MIVFLTTKTKNADIVANVTQTVDGDNVDDDQNEDEESVSLLPRMTIVESCAKIFAEDRHRWSCI